MKILPAMALAVSFAVPIGPILPMAGCTSALNGAGMLTPANVAEAQNIVFGLSRVYTDIKTGFPALIRSSPATDARIGASLNAATVAVNTLSTLASVGGNATALQQVSTALTGVLNVLAVALPARGVPPKVMLGLQAAELLLPDLLTLAGTLVPTSSVPTAATETLPKRFKNPELTKAAAMAVLAGGR